MRTLCGPRFRSSPRPPTRASSLWAIRSTRSASASAYGGPAPRPGTRWAMRGTKPSAHSASWVSNSRWVPVGSPEPPGCGRDARGPRSATSHSRPGKCSGHSSERCSSSHSSATSASRLEPVRFWNPARVRRSRFVTTPRSSPFQALKVLRSRRIETLKSWRPSASSGSTQRGAASRAWDTSSFTIRRTASSPSRRNRSPASGMSSVRRALSYQRRTLSSGAFFQ